MPSAERIKVDADENQVRVRIYAQPMTRRAFAVLCLAASAVLAYEGIRRSGLDAKAWMETLRAIGPGVIVAPVMFAVIASAVFGAEEWRLGREYLRVGVSLGPFRAWRSYARKDVRRLRFRQRLVPAHKGGRFLQQYLAFDYRGTSVHSLRQLSPEEAMNVIEGPFTELVGESYGAADRRLDSDT